MMRETWRERARPIIAEVIGRDDEKALRAALLDAYPFGPRKYYPYKAWLAEINSQLNPHQQTHQQHPSLPGQLPLFG
jgi:alpha-D-ribose 1-methylphosphonate 5-triphosphate synthase subunit PhnG